MGIDVEEDMFLNSKIDQEKLHFHCGNRNCKSLTGRKSTGRLNLNKLIAFLFLLCFSFSSVVEARRPSSSRHAHRSISSAKKRVTRAPIRKNRGSVASRSQRQKGSVARNQPRVNSGRARQPQRQHSLPVAPQVPYTPPVSYKPTIVSPVSRPMSTPLPPQSPPTYFSFLKPHTQKNAQIGGLDVLFSKNLQGQGQTVAVIECSGSWKELRNAIHNPLNNLKKEVRENYKNNFLAAIGKREGLDPEEQNEWGRLKDPYFHGSEVSSVVLDLAPQAKILPVSTYGSFQRDKPVYDVADALKDLLEREKAGVIEKFEVINISAGHINFTVTSREEPDTESILKSVYKTVYTSELVKAFKAVAQAGKVIVIGAGNEGEDIQVPQFKQITRNSTVGWGELIGQIAETLDPETRKSIIIAGNIDPNMRAASGTSNKPGNWREAQDRFLFAPGHHMLSHLDFVVKGTSFSAPYICAAIANLCSKPGVTPKRAVQALLETADQRPEKVIYGRGLIRADKALEWLENHP